MTGTIFHEKDTFFYLSAEVADVGACDVIDQDADDGKQHQNQQQGGDDEGGAMVTHLRLQICHDAVVLL